MNELHQDQSLFQTRIICLNGAPKKFLPVNPY